MKTTTSRIVPTAVLSLFTALASAVAQDNPTPPVSTPPRTAPKPQETPRDSTRPTDANQEELIPGDSPRDPELTNKLEDLAKRQNAAGKPIIQSAAMARPVPQMQAILDELAALGGKPVTTLTPEEARKQPGPADAVKNIAKRAGVTPPDIGEIEDVEIRLSNNTLKGRVYQPEGAGPFPVILYIHGGGWVLADLDTYDATPRALCALTHAVVVSTDYRHAPEFKFPAAHNDAYGAYQWVLGNAGRWQGDPKKIAVVGESAGGNMAASLCVMAQADHKQMPLHQVLIYPVADTSLETASYLENSNARPLNAAMMKWFFDQTLLTPADASNPKIALLLAKDLKGLPPATVITAQIDPLRSEGEALAKKLEADGVAVTYRNFDGVTHEFFGMASVLTEAREAQHLVAAQLTKAFGGAPAVPADAHPNSLRAAIPEAGAVPEGSVAPELKAGD